MYLTIGFLRDNKGLYRAITNIACVGQGQAAFVDPNCGQIHKHIRLGDCIIKCIMYINGAKTR